jgi:hypothetical protein
VKQPLLGHYSSDIVRFLLRDRVKPWVLIILRSLPACSNFALPILEASDLVPLLLVRWQSEAYNLTVLSEYPSGIEPLPAFGTPVDSFSIGNQIFLITPVFGCYTGHKGSSSGSFTCFLIVSLPTHLQRFSTLPRKPLSAAGASSSCPCKSLPVPLT